MYYSCLPLCAVRCAGELPLSGRTLVSSHLLFTSSPTDLDSQLLANERHRSPTVTDEYLWVCSVVCSPPVQGLQLGKYTRS